MPSASRERFTSTHTRRRARQNLLNTDQSFMVIYLMSYVFALIYFIKGQNRA